MRKIFLLFVLLTGVLVLNAQENTIVYEKPYYADLVMGPYLILDGTIYESVILTGFAVGYEHSSGFAFGVEYMAGNQEDLAGQLGTTHSAFGTLRYYTKKRELAKRFRPYVLAGGGFFEFKDFSKDVLGVAFYLGAGLEINVTQHIHGFVEPRYVNTGLMDADGTHQLGVMWGLRARF